MADLELTAFGDRELRIVNITLPEGEAVIPVFVVFYRAAKKEFAKIAPAIGLYPEQATRLEYHFGSVNEWKKRDTFLIQRKHLSKLTETVSGITPAYYYRWPGKDFPMPSVDKLKVNGEEIQPIPDDAEDFLEYVHKKRGIDRNVLRLAWTAVSREAATWLLKKKKPINLGFVNIFAVPYRANWKEILLARFPNGNAPWWFKEHTVNGVFKNQQAEAELRVQLAALEMIAIHNRDFTVRWSVEAVPTEQWEQDANELEAVRKSAGNTNYVRHYEKTVSDMFPCIVNVFMSWLKKIVLPFAEIRAGNMEGSVKMVPYRGKHDVLPKIGKNISVRVVLQDGPAKIGQREIGDSFIVRPKINSLPSLSCASQAADDLRECSVNGDVDKPEDREASANRMSLLPARQSVDIECELLAVRDEPGDEPVAKGD